MSEKEKKNKKAAYAIVEIAHPDPPHESGEMFGFGKKIRRPVGSMIQVPVAVCKDCKRRLDLLDNLRFIGMGAGFLLGLLVIWLIRSLSDMAGIFCPSSSSCCSLPLATRAASSVKGRSAANIKRKCTFGFLKFPKQRSSGNLAGSLRMKRERARCL